MAVHIPAQVFAKGLSSRRRAVGGSHCRVMFEAVEADELHKLLKPWNLRDGACAECVERIVGEKSVAEVGTNCA